MKRARSTKRGERPRREYDFTGGARGRYARKYAAGANVVVLEPDVARDFPDSKSVNDALRALSRVARRVSG